jgi:cold shock CspA family protein
MQGRVHRTRPVEAIIKWFNAEKGFEFIAVVGGSEAFMHIRKLEAAGHGNVPEGVLGSTSKSDKARRGLRARNSTALLVTGAQQLATDHLPGLKKCPVHAGWRRLKSREIKLFSNKSNGGIPTVERTSVRGATHSAPGSCVGAYWSQQWPHGSQPR